MEKLEFVTNLDAPDEDLIKLNKQGLIAGPDEEKFSFFLRVNSIIALGPDSPAVFPKRLQQLFDIFPMHLEILYSNEGMDVWEAGCTWILQNRVVIQLRKHLHNASRWLGMYSKNEILAHEAIHAARMKFYEPIFEEVLAYQTSSWAFRRFWGPLFRSPSESYCLFFFLILGTGIALWYPLFGCTCIVIPPLYFVMRLFIVQSYFHRAMKKIRRMLGITPLWVMLRLTDKEIKMFAREPIPVLENYATKRRLDNLRWRQIYLSYFL
ncbi:hypothetical protein [Candidatus Chlamydia sanziniae]|uniref:Uncharacterized protein n=1 Tax=Candidatus Chlamydia sanziniae TaxID=1806891 RepID=A0A1A9HVY1_9CHLA|nr:hypothetical protein [Candidatus Chlamydia sanziniae]ANH78571.1 hypothetical protein Cs308_0400 [Candidatus Chlamydia sanziniae]